MQYLLPWWQSSLLKRFNEMQTQLTSLIRSAPWIVELASPIALPCIAIPVISAWGMLAFRTPEPFLIYEEAVHTNWHDSKGERPFLFSVLPPCRIHDCSMARAPTRMTLPVDVLRCPNQDLCTTSNQKRGEESKKASLQHAQASPQDHLPIPSSPPMSTSFPSVMYMTVNLTSTWDSLSRSIFLDCGVSNLGVPRRLKWRWLVSIMCGACQFVLIDTDVSAGTCWLMNNAPDLTPKLLK